MNDMKDGNVNSSDMEEKMKEITSIFTISRTLPSTINLDMIMGTILEKSRLLMKGKFCILKLLDDSRKDLSVLSSAGIDQDATRILSELEKEAASIILNNGEHFVIDDAQKHFKGGLRDWFTREGVRSILTVPLFSYRRKAGLLSVYFSDVRELERKDIEIFEMIATLCSMVIDNAGMLDRIRKDYLNTIKTLAKIIEENDYYARGHCDKVMRYALIICRSMSVPHREIKSIRTASLLHDIGKIGVDLSLIRKTEKLNDEDWQKIKQHPEIGAKILSQVGFLNDIVPIVKYHHSRYGGGGYPDPDKKGGDIPLGARIIAVADAYDAMTSDRPYRKAMDKKEARDELRKCAGSQFDPKVVQAFLESDILKS